LNVVFFESPDHFRRWLAEHHASEVELWVGYYKKATGKQTMTWAESVDEALCYGWIDGIRRSVDEESYTNRFTPRRRGSHWSRVNLERVTALIEAGRMEPPGLVAYEARDPARSGRYSFERERARFSAEQEATFRSHVSAWTFWTSQPAGYRKQATWWVTSAKREETRARRLTSLIEDSANGLRIKQFRRN